MNTNIVMFYVTYDEDTYYTELKELLKREFNYVDKFIVANTKRCKIFYEELIYSDERLNERNDYSGWYYSIKFFESLREFKEFDKYIFLNDTYKHKKNFIILNKLNEKIIKNNIDKKILGVTGEVHKSKISGPLLANNNLYITTHFFTSDLKGLQIFKRSYDFITNSYYYNKPMTMNLNPYELNIKSIVCNYSKSNINWKSIKKYKDIDLNFLNRKILCVFNEHYFSSLLFAEHKINDIFNKNFFLFIVNKLIARFINRY